ncbi:MAG: hypothetical protein DDT19_00016 [Syntrophomonadaceae bacterium]|nr:hypothetical protein [Bacillota bacterium]
MQRAQSMNRDRDIETEIHEYAEFSPRKMRGFPSPRSRWVPFEEAVRVAIAWDMPYTYADIVSEARSGNTAILERLFSKSQSVDWLCEVLGSAEDVKKIYPSYKKVANNLIKRQVENLL